MRVTISCRYCIAIRGDAFVSCSFLVNFLFFILGRAVVYAGLTASFRAHVNTVYLLTYLLTYGASCLQNWFLTGQRPLH